MKKILLVLFVALLALSCEKDGDNFSLIGTEWSITVNDYYIDGGSAKLSIRFITNDKVNFVVDGESESLSYSFNEKTKSGYIYEYEDDAVLFTVNGDKLTLKSDEITISFNKIK